jgi:hypothetical protein
MDVGNRNSYEIGQDVVHAVVAGAIKRLLIRSVMVSMREH